MAPIKLDSRFCCQGIQTYVLRQCEDRFGALTVESESHQARTGPMAPMTPPLERAVVEAAAHSQAAALSVHSYQGHGDQIEPARPDRARRRGAVRNGYPERPAPHPDGERIE